jgi:hypothetical protein
MPGPRVLISIGLALTVIVLGLLPIAAKPGPNIPGFVALFVAGFLIMELSTSFLLFARFREARNWSLLVLSCAYFYSGLMTIPHLITFPGGGSARPIACRQFTIDRLDIRVMDQRVCFAGLYLGNSRSVVF